MYTLITAANSSRAYQLKNTLNSDTVLLGDYMELPELLVSSGKMIRLPDPLGASYTHEMLKLCLDRNITTVYALRNEEIKSLSGAVQLFNEYDINIKITGDEV